MIKNDDLFKLRSGVKYTDGQGINVITIQKALQDAVKDYNVPIKFSTNEVNLGSLIIKNKVPCLVLSHPTEKAFKSICIIVQHQGNYAFISFYYFGKESLHTVLQSRASIREEQMWRAVICEMLSDIIG